MRHFNRREFMRGAGFAAASAALGGCSAYPGVRPSAAPRAVGPNDRLDIGVVGAGGQGLPDWMEMFRNGENIAALCDVDRAPLDRAAAEIRKAGRPAPALFRDFRKMLDECKSLDAVVIATPDHMHAPVAIRAMKRGCNVFVEKPLARTIWEARYFGKAAGKCGVVTQMGNQGSASDGFRRNVEILRAGILGKVAEAHVWTDRPIWPQGIARPEGADPVPDTLEWDLWLGAAPFRPFRKNAYHPFNWRGFADFGAGAFGDMACHMMNLPFRGLRLGAVERIERLRADGANIETYPGRSIVKLRYAARGALPAVDLFWYDGRLKPDARIMPPVIATFGGVPGSGCLIIGDRGMMASANDYGAEACVALAGEEKMLPVSKHPACAVVPETLPRAKNQNHYLEFIDACKGRGACFSDVAHSVPLAEGILAGCIVQRVGGALPWSTRRQTFGDKAADALIRPRIRKGWEY